MKSEELARVEEHMLRLAREMAEHRARGRYDRYWGTRCVWLAACRLHTLLYAKELAAQEQQLTLIPHEMGRAHDKEAS